MSPAALIFFSETIISFIIDYRVKGSY